jgi:hypothetical protein
VALCHSLSAFGLFRTALAVTFSFQFLLPFLHQYKFTNTKYNVHSMHFGAFAVLFERDRTSRNRCAIHEFAAVLHCDVSFRCIAPVRENAPKFCAPMCAPLHGSRCDSPSPRAADGSLCSGLHCEVSSVSKWGSGPDHVHHRHRQRIRHVLRIVCGRLCSWYRLGHETHRNAPLSRSRAGGIYPNPRRPENVALSAPFTLRRCSCPCSSIV